MKWNLWNDKPLSITSQVMNTIQIWPERFLTRAHEGSSSRPVEPAPADLTGHDLETDSCLLRATCVLAQVVVWNCTPYQHSDNADAPRWQLSFRTRELRREYLQQSARRRSHRRGSERSRWELVWVRTCPVDAVSAARHYYWFSSKFVAASATVSSNLANK